MNTTIFEPSSEITSHRISTSPFSDQNPGTSGLRKKVVTFQKDNYLENFVQAIFNSLPSDDKNAIVIGGDGRFFNDVAIQRIIKMAVANGYRKIYVCHSGLGSTPAISHLIRKSGANGGIILSASHNPAGPDEDFGIKYNNQNGSPAPSLLTDEIYQHSQKLNHYQIADIEDINLEKMGISHFGDIQVSIVDAVSAYTTLMAEKFDFDLIKQAFLNNKLSLCFDAMHAVTGPFATHLFEKTLGATAGSIINSSPLQDFGGGHPDPNQVHAKQLCEIMGKSDAPIIGAASDGDGDRNLILGQNCFVSPSDSLAIITHYAHLIPQFSAGINGVARSMPTSKAVDRVATKLGLACFETPTGWKYFGNLLDHGFINICGEESFGTGGDHVREKDGLWAVLCWLTIIAYTGKSINEILREHWQSYGRNLYVRYDYEGINVNSAQSLVDSLRERATQLSEADKAKYGIKYSDDFSYKDKIDGSHAKQQGIRLEMNDEARIVYRLSGTGTTGATLRVYLEKFDPECSDPQRDVFQAVSSLASKALDFAEIKKHTGMEQPTVKT